MEGPNVRWINNALESAIEKYGPPYDRLTSTVGNLFKSDLAAWLQKSYADRWLGD